MGELKALWQKYKGWEAARLLRRSVALRQEVFAGYVQEQAQPLALAGVQAFLDREGMIHCAKCPQRGQLRRHGDEYLCVRHAPVIPMKEVSRAAA